MTSHCRAYTFVCKVPTDLMCPCKYLKIRSILCCYLRNQYLTILVLIRPYIDRFELSYSRCSVLFLTEDCFHDCNCHPMKMWQVCLNYTWALKTYQIVCQNEIYVEWIFFIFIACWFLNKTFEVICITKNHRITTIQDFN